MRPGSRRRRLCRGRREGYRRRGRLRGARIFHLSPTPRSSARSWTFCSWHKAPTRCPVCCCSDRPPSLRRDTARGAAFVPAPHLPVTRAPGWPKGQRRGAGWRAGGRRLWASAGEDARARRAESRPAGGGGTEGGEDRAVRDCAPAAGARTGGRGQGQRRRPPRSAHPQARRKGAPPAGPPRAPGTLSGGGPGCQCPGSGVSAVQASGRLVR